MSDAELGDKTGNGVLCLAVFVLTSDMCSGLLCLLPEFGYNAASLLAIP